MGGGGVEGRGRFLRSGPACEAPAVGIRTNIPSQGSPPSAGGVRMPIAGALETGPDRQKRSRPPILPPPIWLPPKDV